MTVKLRDAEATLELGRVLGGALARSPRPPALLLCGDLGAGKTTLTRGLVQALPGADQAEVSSPSFNIVNQYPTRPQVAHFDLYRLENMPVDDEILDQLAGEGSLNIVEWAQFLDRRHWPEPRLELELTTDAGGRIARLRAVGMEAENLLETVRRLPPETLSSKE
ncbi:tRNA (adenosine(37)-N6)-threonylcarbamoyltransferase complex ATPase subunit type 1 TsaE [Desulfovibrio aminophilus]|nr:tRNA (adenosine(37)-N6)-threonylcarbamoyltransferase complex ATPase subunit type 1 TsaE [Desulfovibrio aminophilus]MCM0754481.1 tRNA (adenosine(37)-N6)-threonylcarbamoyltransferase complex ATPase subunit type 1 TsaE [Desulfovibrio aminophilus]